MTELSKKEQKILNLLEEEFKIRSNKINLNRLRFKNISFEDVKNIVLGLGEKGLIKIKKYYEQNAPDFKQVECYEISPKDNLTASIKYKNIIFSEKITRLARENEAEIDDFLLQELQANPDKISDPVKPKPYVYKPYEPLPYTYKYTPQSKSKSTEEDDEVSTNEVDYKKKSIHKIKKFYNCSFEEARKIFKIIDERATRLQSSFDFLWGNYKILYPEYPKELPILPEDPKDQIEIEDITEEFPDEEEKIKKIMNLFQVDETYANTILDEILRIEEENGLSFDDAISAFDWESTSGNLEESKHVEKIKNNKQNIEQETAKEIVLKYDPILEKEVPYEVYYIEFKDFRGKKNFSVSIDKVINKDDSHELALDEIEEVFGSMDDLENLIAEKFGGTHPELFGSNSYKKMITAKVESVFKYCKDCARFTLWDYCNLCKERHCRVSGSKEHDKKKKILTEETQVQTRNFDLNGEKYVIEYWIVIDKYVGNVTYFRIKNIKDSAGQELTKLDVDKKFGGYSKLSEIVEKQLEDQMWQENSDLKEKERIEKLEEDDRKLREQEGFSAYGENKYRKQILAKLNKL